MAYQILESCRDCVDGGCIEVCPVTNCIVWDERVEHYQIDKKECIDCGLCVWECPVEAILHESCE